MTYTPYDRLMRIMGLAKEDPDCAGFLEDAANAEHILELYLEDRPKEAHTACNALPVTLRLYYGRVLELVSREMRFPDEDL